MSPCDSRDNGHLGVKVEETSVQAGRGAFPGVSSGESPETQSYQVTRRLEYQQVLFPEHVDVVLSLCISYLFFIIQPAGITLRLRKF
jgi:hypothetical protein